MAKRRIPYAEALKLWKERESFQAADRLIASARAQQERSRQRLADVHDFLDIPIDKIVDIKLEKGPDKKRMIVVEWEDDAK